MYGCCGRCEAYWVRLRMMSCLFTLGKELPKLKQSLGRHRNMKRETPHPFCHPPPSHRTNWLRPCACATRTLLGATEGRPSLLSACCPLTRLFRHDGRNYLLSRPQKRTCARLWYLERPMPVFCVRWNLCLSSFGRLSLRVHARLKNHFTIRCKQAVSLPGF